jgi:tape measure domain-containing protein
VASVDDKVVAMSFETSKFESGVSRVLSGLALLKKSLTFDKAGKGLSDIDAASKKVDLSHIAKSVDDIRNKFSALSVAALAVFSSIAIQAVRSGAAIAKSFTIQPLIDGFREYETQINAVQTILSNTTAAGTNIRDVNRALDELNTYADKTIYNFSEMAKNIGTFTAAGVDLQTSVNSIKGIANLAALSGSNSQQAATAMYQLSQAISAGKVSLMDWNSVVNAGMGGTVFQRALAQTAVNMGRLDESALKLSGSMKNVTINGKSFRQSLSETGADGQTWLNGEVLTQTLSQLSGNLTDAKLKAEGYTDAQIKAIQTQAKMALEAATQVKTFSQLLSTTSEALSSGWAQTWRIIFGDFNEAKQLFTGISNVINDFIGKNAEARNKVLKDWKKLGGRADLIAGISNIFSALGAVLGTIKDAFRDIFPAKTGKDLAAITKNFKEFTETLKPSEATLDKLRRTFAGIFAVLDIGKSIVGGIFSVIGDLFGAITGGSGGFLELTAQIGDFLVKLRDTIKESGVITDFFEGLGNVLAKPIELIGLLAGALAALFSTNTSGGVSGALGGLSATLAPLAGVIGGVADAWERFLDSFGGSGAIFDTLGESLRSFFGGIGTFIASAFSNINWDSVLAVLNTGLFAALVLAFKKFFGKGSLLEQVGNLGFIENISGVFSGLNGTLGAMQQNLKAKTLKEIAIAVALLAGSIFILSTIEPEKMKTAMAGVAVAMGLLVGAMAALNVVATGPGFLKLPFIAAGLIVLGVAIGILAISVKALSTMNWEELAKGLTGVGALLAALAAAAGPLSRASVGLIGAGVGITAIAIAMKILASAIKDFSGMSWESLGKGMATIAAALTAIGAASRLFPTGMVAIGIGLIGVAAGLKILASAMQDLAGLSWEEIGKGLTVVAGALAAIGVAMKLMPASTLIIGAGLILVATAMKILAGAIEKMGGMSIPEIAKGLITLAGALAILAGALHLMSGTLGGAAALAVAAAGIALLAPALTKLGGQSWTEIVKGMVALAGAIGILAAASVLLGGAVPAMLGMGAALLLIGGGLALAGAGIFLIGLGLAAIATSGTAAIAVLFNALDTLMERLPQYVEDLTQAFITMALSLAEAAPQFIESMGLILIALSQAVIAAAPQLVAAGVVLISNLLTGLRTLFPQIVATGISLLIALLQGLKQNIPQIVTLAVDIVVKFINALAANANRIVTAGVNLVVSLLRGISNNIGRIGTAALQILTRFLQSITNGLGRVVTMGTNLIVRLVTGIGNAGGRLVTAATTAVIKFATSIGNNAGRLVTSGVNIITKLIQGIGKNALRLATAAAQALLDFLIGLRQAIDVYAPQITEAAIEIGEAIVSGIIQGLANKAQDAYNKAAEIASGVLNKLKGALDIFSPSKATAELGEFIVLGLVQGMDGTAPKAYKSAEAMSNGVISAVKKIFQITSPSKVMKELGKFVGDGFLEGLKGSQQSIRDSVAKLSQYLVQTVGDAKAQISKLRADIQKENAKDDPDGKRIAAATAAIVKYQAVIKNAQRAQTELNKGQVKNRADLSKLAKQYTDLANQLKAAEDALADAKKARDDASASVSERFSDLPSMLLEEDEDPTKVLSRFKAALTNQADAVEKYAATLEQLRALGLNNDLYQQLVDEGVGAQEFASQLLAGGTAAIDELNGIDTRLTTASKTFGDQTAKNLYQSGVDAAQGVVDGLKSKMKDVEDAIGVLARTIVKAIRRALRIKSPSRVMAEIGKLTGEGIAVGMKQSEPIVADAVESMAGTIAGLSDILSTDIDTTPTITPVLDLSEVQKGSEQMQGILDNVTSITAAASYGQASSISTQRTAEEEAAATAQVGDTYNFEQNNYSPKALSKLEIYRQTKNQLAIAKAT